MKKDQGMFINFFAGMNKLKDVPNDNMDAILVNTAQVLKSEKEFQKTKEIIRRSGARQVMMDSGGFTILNTENRNGVITHDGSRPFIGKKMELNISVHHVIKAAQKLRPDIMVGLDFPVIKTSDPEIQKYEFNRKKELNLEWMKKISILRQEYCPDIELYLPVQCYTLEQFSYFERELKKLNYNGIALPTRNMNPVSIARYLVRIYEMGIRKVHLLGTSSFGNIALSAYLARNLFERCSIDGCSWRNGAQNHNYIYSDTLREIPVGRRCTMDRRSGLPCRCVMCNGHTFGNIMDLNDRERIEFLRVHNFHTLRKAGRDFYRNSNDIKSLQTYLIKRAPEREKDIEAVRRAIILINSHNYSTKRKRIRIAA